MRLLAALLAAVFCFSVGAANLTPSPPPTEPPEGPAAPLENVDIKVEGAFDESLYMSVVDDLEKAQKAGSKHVTFHINSPGGKVGIGLKLIQKVRETGIPTTCIVEEYAASMAAIFLESSACGERVVHAHSMVMLHGVSMDSEGNQREHQNTIERAMAVNRMAAEIVCARTGWQVDWYLQRIVEESREMWVVGEMNVAFHLADKVIPVPAPVK